LSIRLELGDKVLLLSHLTNFHVCLGVVAEEEFLVLCVSVDPSLKLSVLYEFQVGLRAEVLRLVSQKELLEVSIVENVRVQVPASVWAFLVISAETKSE